MAEILKPINVLTRRLIQLTSKNYIKKKLQKRIGKCNQCGKCCTGCRHLDKKTKLCKIYNKRNFMCYKEFPLDDLDKKIWNVKNCGYKFKK
jgi:hypothetical protein